MPVTVRIWVVTINLIMSAQSADMLTSLRKKERKKEQISVGTRNYKKRRKKEEEERLIEEKEREKNI